MIQGDYHVHSYFSSDADYSPEDIIKRAIEIGLTRICFTDHMDYDYPSIKGVEFFLDVDKYFVELNELEEKYKDKIKVLKGIELGISPYLKDKCNQLIKSYDFDFVIASSHLVNGLDPYYPEYWEGISEEEGYAMYFNTIAENILAFNDFDTYGHIDYIVRCGENKNKYYTYEKYSKYFDHIFNTLIKCDKALEINTAGFKYGLGQMHPQRDVLQRYLELGGAKITIGSDGHEPNHIAYEFEKTKCILKDIGFETYSVFEKRQPILCRL